MTVKIHTNDIKIGMYIAELDRPWAGTPFPARGFFLQNQDQINRLQQLCEYVQVDVNQKQKISPTTADKEDTQTSTLQNRNQSERIIYNPQIALLFFRSFGTTKSVASGSEILTEGHKAKRFFIPRRNKMYLLVKGEVLISVAGQKAGTIEPGEIFGELTPLILSERSATATANGVCELIGLDEKQLVTGLKQQPDFALMLMSVLVNRLRQCVTDAKTSNSLDKNKAVTGIPVFNNKSLRELVEKLGEDSVIYTPAEITIFKQGGVGTLMYIILTGRVTISIDGNIVEHSGLGCIIGEIALVDQDRRIAYAKAETDCTLLAVSRPTFLFLVKNLPSFGLSLLRALAARLHYYRNGHLS